MYDPSAHQTRPQRYVEISSSTSGRLWTNAIRLHHEPSNSWSATRSSSQQGRDLAPRASSQFHAYMMITANSLSHSKARQYNQTTIHNKFGQLVAQNRYTGLLLWQTLNTSAIRIFIELPTLAAKIITINALGAIRTIQLKRRSANPVTVSITSCEF